MPLSRPTFGGFPGPQFGGAHGQLVQTDRQPERETHTPWGHTHTHSLSHTHARTHTHTHEHTQNTRTHSLYKYIQYSRMFSLIQ